MSAPEPPHSSVTRASFVLQLLLLAACRGVPPEEAPSWQKAQGANLQAQQPATPVQPLASDEAAACSGVWESSFGILRLTGSGENITGTYTFVPGATLSGRLEGNILRGIYHEPAENGAGVHGRFAFDFASDGMSFEGTWAPGEGQPLSHTERKNSRWSGRRLLADPDRVWFVVLEENWESSLRADEFSFGAMLRAFFERVPQIGMRHRFVHDRADLERFCGELSALVEPVVLYISAHGSRDSLGIGNEGISPEALGAALRGVGDLRLLHLGSCALLSGDAPERIRLAAGRDFPISGFVESVDWAASAIVDFTYMQLVLEQGLQPAEAVEATRRMLSFANPPGETGPLPGCDLKISLPAMAP